MLREYGRTLPCLKIRDWPDFTRQVGEYYFGNKYPLLTASEFFEKQAEVPKGMLPPEALSVGARLMARLTPDESSSADRGQPK